VPTQGCGGRGSRLREHIKPKTKMIHPRKNPQGKGKEEKRGGGSRWGLSSTGKGGCPPLHETKAEADGEAEKKSCPAFVRSGQKRSPVTASQASSKVARRRGVEKKEGEEERDRITGGWDTNE